MTSWIKHLACLVGLMLWTGCGEPGGVLLIPTVDGAWNSEQQVISRVHQIQLLLDRAAGFSASGSVKGAEIVDADGDGQLEILFSMDVAGRSELPWIRLAPGSEPQRPIAVRLRGLDEQGRTVAYGGLAERPLFDSGDRLNVPFDLNQAALPPFVTAVSPSSTPSGSSLGSLAFFSSRPLDPVSLGNRAHVFLQSTGELTGSWTSREGCPDGVQMWTFTPSACWPATGNSMTFDLVLDAGVSDLEGQVLSDAQGQVGFSSSLTLDLVEFGACVPLAGCTAQEPGNFRMDLRCDHIGGLLQPAPCSNAADSCLGQRSQFGIVAGQDTDTCAGFRPGAQEVDGACVIMDAWPCLRQSDCRSFGAFECDFVQDICIPDSCLDSCPTAGQICVPDWGCQPGLGACLESCAAFGSCADFSQTCQRRDDGLWSCR